MGKMIRVFIALSIVLTFISVVIAQETPQPVPNRPKRVISPEVQLDNTVIFRLDAPNASTVAVSGTWMPGFGASENLTKADAGIWTLTVGPLIPEYYGYVFLVDWVKTLDPSNVLTRRDGMNYENILPIPGKESDLYQVQNVPHGNLAKVWYDSPAIGFPRRMYIYTPPGYERSKGKYPVLYLFHGAGGDEDAWVTMGRACQIMDNLIATKKAKPMIVAMTNGNPFQAAAPGEGPVTASQATPVSAGPGGMASGVFEKSLVNDVIPYVERNFRALKDKNHRAIAGLSMGGFQAQNIICSHPDMFAYIGVMSMGILEVKDLRVPEPATFSADRDTQVETLKKSGYRLYWIGCGVDDFLYKSVQKLRSLLDKHACKYTYRESSGGHTWANWRIYLAELVPLLFK